MPLASAAFAAEVTMRLPDDGGFLDAAERLPRTRSPSFPGGRREPDTIAAKRVEQVMLGFLDDGKRQRPAQRSSDVGAQGLHDGGNLRSEFSLMT